MTHRRYCEDRRQWALTASRPILSTGSSTSPERGRRCISGRSSLEDSAARFWPPNTPGSRSPPWAPGVLCRLGTVRSAFACETPRRRSTRRHAQRLDACGGRSPHGRLPTAISPTQRSGRRQRECPFALIWEAIGDDRGRCAPGLEREPSRRRETSRSHGSARAASHFIDVRAAGPRRHSSSPRQT